MNLSGTIRDKELSGSEQVNSWGPPSWSLRVWASQSVRYLVSRNSLQHSNHDSVRTCVSEQRTTPQRYAHNPCRIGWYWSTGRVARSVHSVAPSPAAMLIALRRRCGSNSIPFIQILRTCFLFIILVKQHWKHVTHYDGMRNAANDVYITGVIIWIILMWAIWDPKCAQPQCKELHGS